MRRALRSSALGVFAAVLLTSCGGTESSPAETSIAESPAEVSERTVTAAGEERTYTVSVPPDATEPLPVIIAFHGRGGTGASFLAGTDLDEAHAIVAAPDGVAGAWAPAPYADTTVEEESEFIEAIVTDLEGAFWAESSQVYLAGFSNGGGLATVAAAAHPDRFAGVATVAAAVRTDPSQFSTGKAIDYMNIHGTSDIKVPYSGELRGTDDRIYGAEDVVAAFRKRNGDTGRVEHLAVDGMGHSWPTGAHVGTSIDVTETILSFFGLNSLP